MALSFPLFAVPYWRPDISFGEYVDVSLPVPVCINLVIVFLDICLFRAELQPKRFRKGMLYVLMFLALFLLIIGTSSIAHSDFNFGTQDMVKIMSGIFIFCIFMLCFPDDKRFAGIFMRIILLSSVVFLGALIYKYFFIFHSKSLGGYFEEDRKAHRNQLSTYIAIFYPFIISLLLEKKKLLLSICGFTIFLLALIYTGSRGAWIATTGGALYLIWVYRRKISRFPFYTLLSGMFAFFVLLLVLGDQNINTYVSGRFASLLNHDEFMFAGDYGRFNYFEMSWQILSQYPFLGSGIGSFMIYSGGRVSHNDYVDILAELGIMGFLVFIMILYAFYAIIFKKKSGALAPEVGWILNGISACLIVMTVRIFFINMYKTPFFWIIMAILLVMRDICADERNASYQLRDDNGTMLRRTNIYR